MIRKKPRILIAAICIGIIFEFACQAFCQPEVMGWGNMTGIRIDGQLMEFETSLCVVSPDWKVSTCTAKEEQRSTYSRNGKIQTITVPSFSGAAISANVIVEETGRGMADMEVEFASKNDADTAGTYLRLRLPSSLYADGKAELIHPSVPAPAQISLATAAGETGEYMHATAGGVRFISPHRKLEVLLDEPGGIIIRAGREEGNQDFQAYFAVMPGKAAAGRSAIKNFSFKADGEIDQSLVNLTLDPLRSGQKFDGLGGNFRLQNPATDPAVIQYNLDNLRVAWGRVEMPWYAWHPVEEDTPLEDAKAGKLNARVDQAMDMARRLARRGIPVIVSAWFPPAWAILGDPNFATGPGEVRGNPLNPEKMKLISRSIADYLQLLKEKYGVEAALFSFNESDLGINIRQTPQEHADFIKTLGAYFAARGLATRMLLGDTSDATSIQFIKPAMQDLEAIRYVGAVSFHSWRGCSDEILAQWRDVTRQLNIPLIVGEGSTDAQAWSYPQIFLEPSFALNEIDLYARILAVSRPESILQWQMTADYSILAGGGVFGDKGPLRPTQRFWNLKQLSSTPAGAFSLPVQCGYAGITCAAFGDIARGLYTIHIVNNGAARAASLSGLPADVKSLRIWITDSQRGMLEGTRIPVADGKAQFQLDAASFTTLMNTEP
jgi:hypothetical protein